jgi:hypothetical protein
MKMTAHTLEHDTHIRPITTLPTGRYDQPERMPLRTDLFLISHDDDTGRPHLEKHSIAVGLAGAILLELWYAGRVRLGWHGNPQQHTWQRNHTHVTLLNATPTHDPIHDTAIRLLWHMGGTVNIKHFINQFATTDLYEAVRDHLTTTGILDVPPCFRTADPIGSVPERICGGEEVSEVQPRVS